ncbi:hypothetical protein EP331_11575 [bacterium]|nr:MAG: hypothetical protein EP331_11575 [bacterium]
MVKFEFKNRINQLKVVSITFIVTFVFFVVCKAHPQGDLVVFNNQPFWTFVHPLEDSGHYAALFTIDKGTNEVVPIFVSTYSGSDVFCYANNEAFYFLETYRDGNEAKRQFVLYKMDTTLAVIKLYGGEVERFNIGSNGFYVDEEEQLVCAKYPNIYKLKNNELELLYTHSYEINGLRKLKNNQILISDGVQITLLSEDFKTIKVWKSLLEEHPENAPLGMNKIFDYDYDLENHSLVVADWGSRKFKEVSQNGDVHQIEQLDMHYAAHLVCYGENELYLMGLSTDIGVMIRPILIRLFNEKKEVLWPYE